ncbi:MAG: 30S ribosomal protein S9 [Candidatus Berkelbacteria bacterium]
MTEKTETTKEIFKAVGRRKTAVASVWLTAGKGELSINNKKNCDIAPIAAPLELLGRKSDFDVTIKVTGGGTESQKDAMIHGLSRSLEKVDPEYRTTLKKAGLLTRDPREKERKKPGLRGARRAPQWAKR